METDRNIYEHHTVLTDVSKAIGVDEKTAATVWSMSAVKNIYEN